jgi:hypothetical protein
MTFFGARIVWLPWYITTQIPHLLGPNLKIVFRAFILLNYYWFFQILKIAKKQFSK